LVVLTPRKRRSSEKCAKNVVASANAIATVDAVQNIMGKAMDICAEDASGQKLKRLNGCRITQKNSRRNLPQFKSE